MENLNSFYEESNNNTVIDKLSPEVGEDGTLPPTHIMRTLRYYIAVQHIYQSTYI